MGVIQSQDAASAKRVDKTRRQVLCEVIATPSKKHGPSHAFVRAGVEPYEAVFVDRTKTQKVERTSRSTALPAAMKGTLSAAVASTETSTTEESTTTDVISSTKAATTMEETTTTEETT